MKKNFRNFALACLTVGAVLGTVNTSQAQSDCDTCGPVMAPMMTPRMGPIRSFVYRTGEFFTYGPRFYRYRPRRIAYYSGTSCQSGCNTGNYQTNYYPAFSYYGGLRSNSCNTGCNSYYAGGCASGNCFSGTTPATGTTPTPATHNPAPVPTTTFKSTEPTVHPDALKNSEPKANHKYDERDSKAEGFSLPARPDKKKKPEAKPAAKANKKTDAPVFGKPFGSTPTKALKVPTAPLVPVEKRKPAPAEIEENGGVKVPFLQLIPAPINTDESQVTRLQTPERTRIVRTARFTTPQVARTIPHSYDSLIPPLPSPIQLAGN